MSAPGSRRKPTGWASPSSKRRRQNHEDLPVTNITWYDTIEYCNRRSQAEGLTPCYTVSGTTVTWNRSAYRGAQSPDVGLYSIGIRPVRNAEAAAGQVISTYTAVAEEKTGKTIVPFCSMGGGRFGQTISAIAKLAPDSVIKEGLEVTYSSYDRAEISVWLENIAH